MNRVRIVPKGTLGIAMPELRKGEVNRKLQGGLPPEAFRARNDWNGASPRARNDGTSKACWAECFHATSEWDASAKHGKGAFVAA